MGVSVAVTVTVIVLAVELAVAELIVREAGTAVVDELSSSPPSQPPSSFGSFESVLSFPVMPPWRPASTKRRRASAEVSHTRLIPGLSSRGRAKQLRSAEEQGDNFHCPASHCANEELTQAIWPSGR